MEKRTSLSVQVVIYRRQPDNKILVLGLRRATESKIWWQPVTGSVLKGESIEDAALRETREETGIERPLAFHYLNYSHRFKPARKFVDDYEEGVNAVSEYAFGIETDREKIELSEEHAEYRWMGPGEAMEHFIYKGNREAVRRLVNLLNGESST